MKTYERKNYSESKNLHFLVSVDYNWFYFINLETEEVDVCNS